LLFVTDDKGLIWPSVFLQELTENRRLLKTKAYIIFFIVFIQFKII